MAGIRRSGGGDASRLEYGKRRHFQKPPVSFRRPLALATFRNLRAESTAPLLGRSCPLYASIIRKDSIADEAMRNGGGTNDSFSSSRLK